MKGLIQQFTQSVSDKYLKHIAFNYSAREIGIKHPNGPIGIVCRDQGQLDLYAAKARVLLSTNGDIYNLGKDYVVAADNIYLNSKHIENFKILGKTFNTKVFSGKEVLSPKGDLSKVYLLTDKSVVVNNRVINTVSLESMIERTKIFEDELISQMLPDYTTSLGDFISKAIQGVAK